MLGRDTILNQREKKVHDRTERLEQQRAAHDNLSKRRRDIITSEEVEKILSEDDENTKSLEDDDFYPTSPKKKKKRSPALISQLNPNTLTKSFTEVSDRLHLSVRGTMAIEAKIVKAVGAPHEQFAISKSNVHRQQKKERESQFHQLKYNYECNRPLHPCGHWDSKLVSSLNSKTIQTLLYYVE